MTKRSNTKPLSPSKKLVQLLDQHKGFDHSNQEIADGVISWLKMISIYPIADCNIHVTLGGTRTPLVIVIDWYCTEIAEALAHGTMPGAGVVMEPNVVAIGGLLFTATAEPIDVDNRHVSRLSIQIISVESKLARPSFAMVPPTQIKERERADDLTIAYMILGAKRVMDMPGFRVPQNVGELECVDMVIGYALMLDRLADGREFTDVFEYVVAAPFGEFVAAKIGEEGSLSDEEAMAKAMELIEKA